jgi:hypothetical protein
MSLAPVGFSGNPNPYAWTSPPCSSFGLPLRGLEKTLARYLDRQSRNPEALRRGTRAPEWRSQPDDVAFTAVILAATIHQGADRILESPRG